MKPIHLFDANSWVRRCIEADATGLPLRNLITDVHTTEALSLFVWDGKGGNDRRRALFPGYKMKRKPPTDDIWATMNLCKDLLKHSSAIQVTIPTYEADDVIAALVETYSSRTSIQIFSTDRDLFALCVHPGVRHHVVTDPKVPARLLRLYKATVGDPSDNIPGVKGFGEKAWLDCDQEALLSWYQAGCCTLPDPDTFRISKTHANWMTDNLDLVRTFWTIIGFMPPSTDEISKHTIVGKRDDHVVAAVLRKYLQA